MRMLAVLDELADAGHAGGPQQLAQLVETRAVAVGQRRDQVRTLAGAARAGADRSWRGRGRSCASVAASLHSIRW